MSNNWNLTMPQMGDSNKESTYNTAFENLIKGLSEIGSLVFPSDADYTPSFTAPAPHTTYRWTVTSAGSLTAPRNLIVPKEKHVWVFKNSTTGGQSIVVKGSTGTGITIANGAEKKVLFDGTNFIETL